MMNQTDFNKNHPHPDALGLKSLYRFSKLDENHPEYLERLLIEGKLYHATADQFNDPFECKPHYNWPTNPAKVTAIRKHLIKVAKTNGASQKKAELLISNHMKKRINTENSILSASHRAFSKIRICSFTTDKRNLLFWSHYAYSHMGFCIEFDATKMPIMGAFKVRYQNEYPEVEYPPPNGPRAFVPLLTKSKCWEYEQEFRTIFNSSAKSQPKNDGKSLILSGNEILNIYFGAKISVSHKDKILGMISEGPFSPKSFDTELSKSSFELNFFPHPDN